MLEMNAFIINGKSTADLPFFCAVEENAAPTMAGKKNKLYELENINGAVVQTIDAWETIEKSYHFYLYDVTKINVRAFKSFIGYNGWFTSSDDPAIHFNFLKTKFESQPLDETNGYAISVTFTCEPFEYEAEKEKTLGSSIINPTNSPMYPRIVINGTTASSTFLQIGAQRMTFSSGIDTKVTIECKHGLQDVLNKSGQKMNSKVRGPFFEIPPGTHAITRGTGITSATILERWGWI